MTQEKEDIVTGLNSIFDNYVEKERLVLDTNPDQFLSKESYHEFISNLGVYVNSNKDNIGLQYNAPLTIKDGCILIRDSNLQLQRAKTKLLHGFISKDNFHLFQGQILFSLVAGLLSCKEEVVKQKNQDFDDSFKDSFSETKKPWEAVFKQLEKIGQQIENISSTYEEIRTITPIVEEIQSFVNIAIESNDNSFNEVHSCLNELREFIKIEDKNKLLEEFEDLDSHIQNIPMSKSNLDISIEQLIGQLPKLMMIPVASHRGSLVVKEVPIQKLLKDWIWLEILPEIYEIWELNEVCVSSIKSTATNVKNRLSLLRESEEENFDLQSISSSIESVQKGTTDLGEKKDRLRDEIVNKLNSELHLERLYSTEEEFLSAITWSSNLDASGLEKSPIVETIQSLYKKGITLFNEVRNDSLIKEEDNSYELLSDYILRLKFDEHSDYNSIFLTKSYSGKSFYINREQESEMVQKSFIAWQKGLKGSLLLTGDRYSGKSSFGEKVLSEQKLFQRIVIRPNSKIRYNGRKHFTTKDLRETLKFLKKYNDNKKTILFIDDIGSWFTEKQTVVSNLNALLEFTDNNYAKFFVLCGMDNALLYHLGKRLDIKSSFVKTIDLSKAKHAEFHKIIEMRHGATHMVIKDKEGNKITREQFAQYTRQVFNSSNKNIGVGLRMWAHSLVEDTDGGMVFSKFKTQELPDFLDDNNSIVIKTILLTKSISEYQLRGILGPMFKSKYRAVLSRLMGIGLIERNLYQQVQINEDLVNEVANKLNAEGYL